MFELREYDQSSNKQHIWFNIESEEEAIDIMLKRCFGTGYVHKSIQVFGTNRYYTDTSNMILIQRKPNGKIYDFDNAMGPSTEFIFEIGYE